MIKILSKHTNNEGQRISVDHKFFLFPGGEVSVKLDANSSAFQYGLTNKISIIAKIQNSNDFMELAMAQDAILEIRPDAKIDIFLPYVPYAQQDRYCDKGESFSLKVFAKLLNSLNFERVVICDPHSGVTPALINNVKTIYQIDIIHQFDKLTQYVNSSQSIFVAPDSGANKKTADIAKYFEHKEFVRADKLRDLTNGKILETIVYKDDFKGQNIILADDLCIGGATFTELAKVCKAKNCGKIALYATHAVMSKGTEHLLKNGIDKIFTTNSRFDAPDFTVNEHVEILKLEDVFNILLG